MAKTFEAQVADYISKYKNRMEAVVRGSVTDTIKIASTPTAKGGKMRVQTGFLRASGAISFSGMPSGPNRGEPDETYDFDEGPIELMLANFEAGEHIYFGWSAEYARIRETYDGFRDAAAQAWQDTVDENARKLRSRLG